MANVAKQTGMDADKVINVNDSRAMTTRLAAIITYEKGSQPINSPPFIKALDLAA